MSDPLPEVGPWAKDKLAALARYLNFYTTVLKNQRWRTIYLDAYAGGGRAVIRADDRAALQEKNLFGEEPPIDPDTRELIDGSPRIALKIAKPFDRYVFVEPNAQRAGQLRALHDEFKDERNIVVRCSTAAEGIAWILEQNIAKKSHRGVAFLDPFGAGLHWESIQKLADTGLFEVVINFALSMAIQRMLPNSGEVPASWASRLDSFFGGRSWFDEAYQKTEGRLFGGDGFEKRGDYSDRLLQLYRAKLKAAFGHVSTPRLIKNTRGAPLYYLLWAGPNRRGLEGADYILKMAQT